MMSVRPAWGHALCCCTNYALRALRLGAHKYALRGAHCTAADLQKVLEATPQTRGGSSINKRGKWTPRNVQVLRDWNDETSGMFGPPLGTAKLRRDRALTRSEPIDSVQPTSRPIDDCDATMIVGQGNLSDTGGLVSKERATPTRSEVDVGGHRLSEAAPQGHGGKIESRASGRCEYEEVTTPPTSLISASPPTPSTVTPPLLTSPPSHSFVGEWRGVIGAAGGAPVTDALNRVSIPPLTPLGGELSQPPSQSERVVEAGAFLTSILHCPLFDCHTLAPRAPQGAWPAGEGAWQGAWQGPPPSVSAVLSETMSAEGRAALQRWEQGMVAELGQEGFNRARREMLQNGVRLHACIQELLGGEPAVDVPPALRGHWASVQPALALVTDVVCQEQSVRHRALGYKGVLDCVAAFSGVRSVVEWKTSKRARSQLRHTYDNPLQLAAYLGAYNSDPTNEQVEQCVLVIAHEDGSPADVHVLDRTDCVLHWRLWLRRVHAYWAPRCTSTH